MTRVSAQQRYSAWTLGIAGTINTLFVLINYLHVCDLGDAKSVTIMQMLTEASLLPSAVMYLTRDQKTTGFHTKHLLWVLVPFVLIPKCVILLDSSHAIFRASDIQLFTVNLFYGVNKKHSIYTSDVVMMLQAAFTLRYLFGLARHHWREHSLFSRRTLPFAIWTVVASIFIGFELVINTNSILDPLFGWIFFGGYSILITSIFSLIALTPDNNPVTD